MDRDLSVDKVSKKCIFYNFMHFIRQIVIFCSVVRLILSVCVHNLVHRDPPTDDESVLQNL